MAPSRRKEFRGVDNLRAPDVVREKVKASRDEEFRDFVHGTPRRLMRISFALTGDWGAAEDLLQEVLVKLHTEWRRIDDPMAYCRRSLVNSNIDRWRRRRRRPEVPLAESHDLGSGDTLAQSDNRDQLVRALAGLPRGQRAVLVLRFLEDLPEAETAAALGCSAGTVKSQTSRGLGRLRAVLAEPQSPTTTEGVR